MAIGRQITLTPNIASKVISATAAASQKQFTVTGGYRIDELSVYRNGIRLVNGQDYTATDGLTVTLTEGAVVSDIFEFQIFDSFNIADAIDSNSANQTINGNLTVSGTLNTGAGTSVSFATTAFGLAETPSITVASITGAASTLSGITKITNSTASTSSSTGALIVTGGVGIGKSLFVSEGISVGGTITYDDVTNIDSVGIVTAGKGLRATTGGLIVSAGISTFTAVTATKAYFRHSSSNETSLYIESDDTSARIGSTYHAGGGAFKPLTFLTSGIERMRIYHDGGVNITGVCTATSFKGDGSALSGVVSGIEVKSSGTSVGTSLTALNFSGASITTGSAGITTITIAAAGLSTSAYAVPTAGLTTYLKLSDAQDHKLTASGITTVTCYGGTEGESHTLRIVNSGVSTVGFSTYFLWPSGAAPSLTSSDGAINLVSFTVQRVGTAGTQLLAGVSLDFS